ncbi:MAG TPA: hypothetical protein PLD99_00515 [Parcubacteria group bacterium]|nr:hypothetical protein [Parcubacteria group bacterium]
MATKTEEKVEETFSKELLFDFSEAFKRNKELSPRRSFYLVFLDTCREFRIFGERQKKFFEVFAIYRATVRIPEGIRESAYFLHEEAPHVVMAPVVVPVTPPVKKVRSLPNISVRSGDTHDRHESQLPRGDRNDDD